MMRMDEFLNLLRILTSIDGHELDSAGIRLSLKDWEAFRADPYRWFIRADDATARKLWTIIERRHEPMFKTSEGLRNDTEAAP